MATLAPVRSERRRRALHRLSTILIAAGVLVLVDAAATVLWMEPLTALQTSLRQHGLRKDLRALDRRGPTPLESRALAGVTDADRRVRILARSLEDHTAPGDAIARLKIPRLGADFVVVKGSDPSDLRKGPGTYDDTPLPGVGGTTAIAGHRTTYLAPFRHLDDLHPGDRITVEMPYATFTYRVQRTRIVSPAAIKVLRDVGYDRLILSACHPLFSAAQRIVVVSRLTSMTPLGIAIPGQGSETGRRGLTSTSG
ncbi:MAG TPA: class E sortase [Baekduia sp.]